MSTANRSKEHKMSLVLDFYGDSAHHQASRMAALTYAAHVREDNPSLTEQVTEDVNHWERWFDPRYDRPKPPPIRHPDGTLRVEGPHKNIAPFVDRAPRPSEEAPSEDQPIQLVRQDGQPTAS